MCCICGEQEEGLFLIHRMMPFGLAGHCSTQRLSEHGDCFLAWTSSVTKCFFFGPSVQSLRDQIPYPVLQPPRCMCTCSAPLVMSNSVTPWAVARQAPLWDSLGKNTGVGCHALLQGIFSLPPGIEPTSVRSPALAGGFFTTSTTWEAPRLLITGCLTLPQSPHPEPSISHQTCLAIAIRTSCMTALAFLKENESQLS